VLLQELGKKVTYEATFGHGCFRCVIICCGIESDGSGELRVEFQMPYPVTTCVKHVTGSLARVCTKAVFHPFLIHDAFPHERKPKLFSILMHVTNTLPCMGVWSYKSHMCCVSVVSKCGLMHSINSTPQLQSETSMLGRTAMPGIGSNSPLTTSCLRRDCHSSCENTQTSAIFHAGCARVYMGPCRDS